MIEHAEPDQVGQVDIEQAVAADRHRRVRDDVAHRGQPRSVGELHVQARLGGENARSAPAWCAATYCSCAIRSASESAIGSGARRTDPSTIRSSGRVVADDVDVLHIGQVQQLLQPAESPDGVLHRAQHRDLAVPVELRFPRGHPPP